MLKLGVFLSLPKKHQGIPFDPAKNLVIHKGNRPISTRIGCLRTFAEIGFGNKCGSRTLLVTDCVRPMRILQSIIGANLEVWLLMVAVWCVAVTRACHCDRTRASIVAPPTFCYNFQRFFSFLKLLFSSNFPATFFFTHLLLSWRSLTSHSFSSAPRVMSIAVLKRLFQDPSGFHSINFKLPSSSYHYHGLHPSLSIDRLTMSIDLCGWFSLGFLVVQIICSTDRKSKWTKFIRLVDSMMNFGNTLTNSILSIDSILVSNWISIVSLCLVFLSFSLSIWVSLSFSSGYSLSASLLPMAISIHWILSITALLWSLPLSSSLTTSPTTSPTNHYRSPSPPPLLLPASLPRPESR